MPFVDRDNNGEIICIYNNAQHPAHEWLSSEHPDMLAFNLKTPSPLASYPSDIQIVSELNIYNRKKAKARAAVSVAGGVVYISAQKFDEETESWVNEIRFQCDRALLKATRDRFTGYAALIQAFLDEIKDL